MRSMLGNMRWEQYSTCTRVGNSWYASVRKWQITLDTQPSIGMHLPRPVLLMSVPPGLLLRLYMAQRTD